ncbi:DUF6702 family protein [Thalassotalea sp. Y01]|uniref:DUF6702 family protein n=1 Tax=Thalassotalea sp. Y01 TaxID=2729613 RepID=UPI00145F0D90|nr:DUF6702 family protein [Thalassotalea sp. Y01]NMP14894.1 hypothetical protein [Thalassotalea sp. Y01]
MKLSFITQKLIPILTMFVMMMSTVVSAHQQKEAYSSILFNERTNNIEVSHRFYLHDAEHAIADILGSNSDLLSDLASQQNFATYIQKQFRLLDQSKNPLALGSVGFEVEGKYFWVYQEIAQPENLSAIYIKMRALQDVWPGQINQINVEYSDQPTNGNKVRSVRVSEDDDWQRIEIER